ncbi:WD repeat protein, putative [Trichomonas vaginalis G3]|uniref:WD repeat protein, putative n=1 Tax=Trichomonas vaginalis (strain ATCC PRA-98 / G3) TaxID=412133 RepID=A2DDD7_TRIV3|nr:transcription corepressor protein [Trichomonas vaginalis G3]EAY21616.1 WD repeat protein, putative [Trichomonas vaginalis G3]KAI5489708.1 transcription corepressor protein [Trichomonas vaginalis G3]|eukprot:XP_001582602.1 WD repeat protein [Trichomonas vaginalis G3]
MSISQDEMNYLVYRYLQENGFVHSAFIFESESLADSTNISGSQIPPNALITLLQKSLQYMKLEKAIRLAKEDPKSQAHEGIEQIEKAYK